MSKVVVAIVVVAAVVLGGVLFAVSGGDGDGRKASIGSEGKKPNDPPGQAISNEQAPDQKARGKSAAAPGKVKAAEAMQRRIARRAERRGGSESFASYVDETGQIVLVTDAPDAAIAEVTADSDPANKKELDKVKVQKGTKIEDVWHRRDDVPAFWGGGGITNAGGVCSAGYAAKNSSGTVYSVTAGHCFPNGATPTSESGAQAYGTVSNRRLPSVTGHPMDIELVGGRTYAGSIFTGGITSATSIRVVGAGPATVGFTNACHSGRTTGQSCGHTVNSVTGQVCTSSGCKSPVIVFTGGNMIQPGDSGGTFYTADATSAWVRGNVIASGGGTGYATPWTAIAQEFGLSIVTG